VGYVELKLMHLKTEERYIYTIPLDAMVQGMDYASLSLYGHEVLGSFRLILVQTFDPTVAAPPECMS
jgi:hypothetical protein